MAHKRPPIIVVLGHVDHGKSTLLDHIRKSNVVETEAGGITQRLSAYEVVHPTKDGKTERITFLDTPGHAAFSKMRLRGVEIADIAILVVSAEEGVKPQTREALDAIKEGGIPYVVAINKIDKPGANVERTKQGLAESEVYLEGYGGQIPWVPISAKRGDGVADLLDIVLLLAELEELKANPNAQAKGTVIEASVDKRGIGATLLISDGTLRSGQYVVSGESVAPTRLMEDHAGRVITEATFSSPIRVIGFSSLPSVGSAFRAARTKKEAESAAAARAAAAGAQKKKEAEETRTVLPLVIKGDTAGIIEAIEQEAAQLPQERVVIRVVLKGTGDINESDIKAASGSAQSLVVGFNVKVDERAKELAERLRLPVMTFDVIYKLTEWLGGAVAERTPKVAVEEVTGSAKILKIFSEAKGKIILGGKVQSGMLKEGDIFRVMRRDVNLGEGKILRLQQQKKDVSSAESGEFGAEVKTTVEAAPGDVLEIVATVMK